MKPTNFDRYLANQLKASAFATRFTHAGAAWDVALQHAAHREQFAYTATSKPIRGK
jgi:hypothetical protein